MKKQSIEKVVSERGDIIRTLEGYYLQESSVKGSWLLMMRDMRKGKNIVGFGTWREAYSREFPGKLLPAVCPENWEPIGMSYSEIKKDWDIVTKYESEIEREAVKRGTIAKLTKPQRCELEKLYRKVDHNMHQGDGFVVDFVCGGNLIYEDKGPLRRNWISPNVAYTRRAILRTELRARLILDRCCEARAVIGMSVEE